MNVLTFTLAPSNKDLEPTDCYIMISDPELKTNPKIDQNIELDKNKPPKPETDKKDKTEKTKYDEKAEKGRSNAQPIDLSIDEPSTSTKPNTNGKKRVFEQATNPIQKTFWMM